MSKDKLTNNFGAPVANDLNTMTAGLTGPALMQDVHLLEKLAHFDRERIPERVVHAKGAGAYGYFEVTRDVSSYTKAKFLSEVGKKLMFSSVFLRSVAKKVLPTLSAPPGALLSSFTLRMATTTWSGIILRSFSSAIH